MAIEFNHTIIRATDPARSAAFLADMLGRRAPTSFARFEVVALDNAVELDFAAAEKTITPQHYAFLIGEEDFDAVMKRITERGLPYWADPARERPGEINHRDGGRGVYFPDPDGHMLEVLTRPHGAGEGAQ